MLRKRKLLMMIGVLILASVLFSCGTIPPAPLIEKSAQTATVYFLLGNTVTLTGNGLTLGSQFSLWDSDTFISMIGGNEYISFNFPAGTHYFMASAGNWYIVQAELARGKTYFFELTTVPGFRQANVLLKIMEPTSAEIDNLLGKYKEISPKGKTAEGIVNEARKQLTEARGGSQNIDVVPSTMGR